MPLERVAPPACKIGDRVHVDLLDMPKTTEGHVAICTLVDTATGFTIILQFFRKTCGSMDEQANWHKSCAELQTIINSTKSATREHSPFFLTFFHHSNYPLPNISSQALSYNEEGTVAAKLNLAKRTAKTIETLTEDAFQKYKQQFDKDIQNRRFFPGFTVYVYTTQRGKTHRKLFRLYKGPYKCIGFGKNGNLLLEPMKGGNTISIHKNNCKMAPFHEQFYDLILTDKNSQQKKPGRRVPTSRLFRYPEAGIPSSAIQPPHAENRGSTQGTYGQIG